ncbi:uncharacterized protein LOC131889495 [Tigriopus californicus]|uniref:uncharacterized protein LOC131889495 n=1 Tax=Tigriopus californicus TaxID=6832 RepID=UPI0027DAA8DB|nr:uncharacterized protein LOC131889495 [Tigriopus californicus]
MNEYFEKGYAHLVPSEEVKKPKEVFYLPHSAVIREESLSTSVRIVFNASAVYKGASLNESTLVGPKLQKDILDILIKMRSKPVVIAGDISKMFLQIQLASTDRDYVRFLWRKDKSQAVQVCRFSSLVFGLACSPYLANAVIQDLANRHGSSHPMASQTLKNDIYVDDVFIFAESSMQALAKLDQVNEVLQEGSFTLTKFYSNSLEVCNAIPEEKLNPKALLHLQPDEQKAKALGVSFHTSTDELVYHFHSVAIKWDPNAV